MDKNYNTDANTMHQTNHENQITDGTTSKPTITYVEACAGFGTISLALREIARRLGIKVKCEAISEIDPKALEAFHALNGETRNLGDLSKVKWDNISASFVSITFPCQDISSAGTQKGFDEGSHTRSSLVWSFARMLSEMPHKPTFIFMENVAAILNKRNKPTFDKLIAYLESQGYYVHFHKIDAADYGIPQHRERVFIICVLGHDVKFDAPAPMPLRFTLSEILEKDVDEKYYLKKLKNYFIEHSMESPYTFRVMNPSHCDVAYTITTRSGSRISDNFIFEDDISTDKVVRIKEKNLSKLGIPLDKVKTTRIRKLTPTEVMRLFGLTEDEIAKLSHLPDTTIYQLMGNSIVVPALTEYLYAFFKAYMEQVLMIPVDDVKSKDETCYETKELPTYSKQDENTTLSIDNKKVLESILDNHSRLHKINRSSLNSNWRNLYAGFHKSYEFKHKGATIKVVQQVIDYGNDIKYCITYFHNGKPRNHNISYIRGIYENICYNARAEPKTFPQDAYFSRANALEEIKHYVQVLSNIIALHDQMKGCYFYNPPTNAANRRCYEAQHSLSSNFFYNGHLYNIEQVTQCSCKNVYYKMHIYEDEIALDKDIRFIKSIWKKLCEYIE